MRCCKKIDIDHDDIVKPLSPTLLECLRECVFPPHLRTPVTNPTLAKPPIQDMIIDRISDCLIWRGPGSLRGTELRISNCISCTIILLDDVSSITVDDCVGCDIILVASSQSTFLRASTDCRFAVSSGQLRIRDLRSCSLFLQCNTAPIIESSNELTFMPFCIRVDPPDSFAESGADELVYYINYTVQSAQARASLLGLRNKFENVYNFTPEYNKYTVLCQTSSNIQEIGKPPVIRFPSDFKSLEHDSSLLINHCEQRPSNSNSAMIAVSGGMVHGLLKPVSLAQANLFGEEYCYFWVNGVDQTLDAQEYSRQYTQASMWWSIQLYGLLAAHRLHIRQVAAVLPSSVERGGIPMNHGFLVSVSSPSNTLPNLIEVVRKFQACGLTMPPIKILSGADICHAKELIDLWNREALFD